MGMATFILRDSQALHFAVSQELIQPFLACPVSIRLNDGQGA